MTTTGMQGCDRCNKSSLSLLLLRPSPIAKDVKLAPVGSSSVATAAGNIDGLVPAKKPTESRYVLRLLRAGYVHVYIPNPPAGVRQWLVYRVTDNADLIEQGDPVFAQMPPPPACGREGHNSAGMKLLRIPSAHKISTLWIAYSANLWTDAIKSRNAANPNAMQQISLQSCGRHAFTPTMDALKSQVLECALSSIRATGLAKTAVRQDLDFPFVDLSSTVEQLCDNLRRAAECHPKTKGLEMAVILRDPAGIAAELNSIRLRRHGLAAEYSMQPEVRHPLEVNKVIQLLRGNLISDADERSAHAISPLVFKKNYEAAKAQPGKLPAGTTWRPIDAEERKQLIEKSENPWLWVFTPVAFELNRKLNHPDLGRMIYPDWEERADRWATKEAKEVWSKMLPYYDEDKRKSWQDGYEKALSQLVHQPLKREEADWAAVLQDATFLDYFATHFDEKEANAPKDVLKRGCCAGDVYVREAVRCFTPEPFTDAAAPVFEAQLEMDMADAKAVMLRAVMANQLDLASILQASALESDDGKRDKTYDFIKGLIGEAAGVAKDKAATEAAKLMVSTRSKRYAWLTDATLGFSFGLVGTLAAVATNAVVTAIESRGISRALATDKAWARLNTAQTMTLIHRASEEALSAAMQGRAPNAPVFLLATFDVDTAVQIKQGRGEKVGIKTVRRWSKQGRVQMGILTDAESIKTLAEAGVDPKLATRELATQAPVVRLQEQGLALKGDAVKAAVAGGTLVVPVSKFIDVLEDHQARVSRAPSIVTEWLKSLGRGVSNVKNSTVVQSVREGGLTMEGRLAVGSMIVQGIGVVKGFQSYAAADDADKLLDAKLSIADGAAGFLGGMAELAGAAWEARLLAVAGKAAVEASATLSLLRGAGYGLGFAGNVVNAWMSFRGADKLKKQGNPELAWIMWKSGALFLAGGVPLGVLTLHSLAEAAVKRGIGGVGARLLVEKIGETLAKRWFLSVPGWGWALTVVAVGHTIYVIQNTPTAMQNWLKTCHFGKPDRESDRRKSWADEETALKQMQEDLMTPEEKEQRAKRAHAALLEASERA